MIGKRRLSPINNTRLIKICFNESIRKNSFVAKAIQIRLIIKITVGWTNRATTISDPKIEPTIVRFAKLLCQVTH